jgi:hypothetical protein
MRMGSERGGEVGPLQATMMIDLPMAVSNQHRISAYHDSLTRRRAQPGDLMSIARPLRTCLGSGVEGLVSGRLPWTRFCFAFHL